MNTGAAVPAQAIRADAISPGAIPPPLGLEIWGDRLESPVQFLLDHQALKFRGSPQDVAEAARFLISERARFITGQTLVIGGGWWML